MNQLVTIPAEATKPRAERLQVFDAVSIMDTARFDQMYRIARAMATSTLIPESLCTVKEGSGPDRKTVWLSVETVAANCFQLVNQAIGWGMDPFAVAQCASFVHGKVCYEGKLIAAVVEQKLGIRLSYAWNDKQGDAFGITVSGCFDDEAEARTLSGTVGEWKTTGNGSPWIKQPRMQLAYRGARDWARLHAPAVILGVYSIDEMEGALDRQARLPTSRPMIDGANEMRASAPAQSKLTPPDPNVPSKPKEAAAPQDMAKATPAAKTGPGLPPDPGVGAGAPSKGQEAAKVTDAPKSDAVKKVGFDLEAFHTAMMAAPTADDANRLFDLEVTNRRPPLTNDEMDECDAIAREAFARFDAED